MNKKENNILIFFAAIGITSIIAIILFIFFTIGSVYEQSKCTNNQVENEEVDSNE